MIVGGYSLHLYCDHPRHKELHPTHFTSLDADYSGYTEVDCKRQARNDGWTFSRDYKCYCKTCRNLPREALNNDS